MSERRLRKKCRTDEIPSRTSNSAKKWKSETISSFSPPTVDINSEKRVRKRKIRCTQDFNVLSSSMSSQESDGSTERKIKKSQKNVKISNLPRISWLSESLNVNNGEKCDGVIKKKKNRRKQEKYGNEENLNYRDTERKSHKIIDKTDSNGEDHLNQKICKDIKSTENDHEQVNSIISKSDEDSDVEIITKQKKVRRQKNKNKNFDLKELNSDEIDSYAKRIKVLLSEESIRKTKSNEASNSSCSSDLFSAKKRERSSAIKKVSTPNINPVRSTPERFSQKIVCTPHPKKKLSSNSQETNLSENKKISRGNSILSVNLGTDMDFDSDDVFESTFKKKRESTNEHQTSKNNSSLERNIKIEPTRKSVRFESPNVGGIRTPRLILSESIENNSGGTLNNNDDIFSEATDTISEARLSLSGNTISNSTFEITSPKSLNQENFEQDIMQNNNVLSKENKTNKSHRSSNYTGTRKSSLKLSTPVNRSFSKSNKKNNAEINVIDLTTPAPIKIKNSGDEPGSTISNNADNLQFNRQSIISKHKNSTDKVVQIEKNRISKNNISTSENVPKLVRTATFTKEDEPNEGLPNLLEYLQCNSPFEANANVNIVDTSKVNKRKRWDKSRASTVFLDNSLDIRNTSAPWQESCSIWNKSDAELNLDDKCSPIINCTKRDNKINKNMNNQTPPSSTSTPYPADRTNLLRQAVSKGKTNTAMVENKNHKDNNEKPKIIRTKIPNFALIHQRAYDKLENLQEMSERKAARAKLLLSGHKPPNDTSKTSSKKELTYSPVPLREKVINKTLNKSNILITKIKDVTPSTSNPKVVNKENRLTPLEKKKDSLKAKQTSRSKLPNTVVAEKKGFTRFGFKVGSASTKLPVCITKEEQVKAVATKSKILKNTLDERRGVIQGVRSNRRFELLMKMRNKN